MAERVLTLRELNRATLARQLLLERKRLSPAAVVERLVGMQAQWPAAPYVGIWTRTASFRRGALERELARAAIVKATVMRQTLHLVTRRDYVAALGDHHLHDYASLDAGSLCNRRIHRPGSGLRAAQQHATVDASHAWCGRRSGVRHAPKDACCVRAAERRLGLL